MHLSIADRLSTATDVPPGEITAVRIISAIDNRPLFCACERKPGEHTVTWTLSGPRSAVHQHPIGYRDEGWVLGKALDSTEGDRVYRAAVLAAAEYVRHLEASR